MKPRTTPIRVLIVDDHPIVRVGLKTVLEQEPDLLITGAVTNGIEARQSCESSAPNVVLLDIRLGNENGIRLCRDLRQRWPELRVIFLTSYADAGTVVAALGAGANGYLLKAVDGTDIPGAIRRVAGGGVVFDPVVTPHVASALGRPPAQPPVGLDRLTPTEIQLLRLVARGMTNKEIGCELNLAEKTIRNHMVTVFDKLGVRTRTEAALLFAHSPVA
jgi:DNA-binding NarL/FixJ family response regulator